MLADGASSQRELEKYYNFIASIEIMQGKATAYVCENGVCNLPITDPEDLRALLERFYHVSH
jgi:uncharacterized protein